jgi:5-methylcytosine-specific restriction endonuclease McrA
MNGNNAKHKQSVKGMKVNDIKHLKLQSKNFNISYSTRSRANGKLKILERDGYECVICHSKDDLTLHHISGGKRKYNSSRCYKDNETVTLCVKCHRVEHKFKRS